MEELQQLFSTLSWLLPLLIFLIICDLTWKLIGLWNAGRNNEVIWFLSIALINSLGILPIIYIIICKNRLKNN